MTSDSLSSEAIASELEQELDLERAEGPDLQQGPDLEPEAKVGRPRASLANAVRVFRHRNYRLFFGSQLVSLIGTWMQSVAQAWLVLELTR